MYVQYVVIDLGSRYGNIDSLEMMDCILREFSYSGASRHNTFPVLESLAESQER